MGRGKKRGREGGGGGLEDQYGEGMMSQDRGDRTFSHSTGGSFKGGGDAGVRSKENISFTRSVPKFLQPHIHLLGRKPQHEDDPVQLSSLDEQEKDEDKEEDEDQEALEKAVMDDPELAKQYPELQHVADRARANAAKEAGNRAFASKDYDAAIRHFTEAIALHKDAIFYSNRAAAYHALGQYKDAVADAKEVICLNGKWAKGWSRLGAALYALEEWSEAKDAYSKALEIEPDDASLRSMHHKATIEEKKQETEGVFKYKTSRQQHPQKSKKERSKSSAAGTKNTALLSFEEDE